MSRGSGSNSGALLDQADAESFGRLAASLGGGTGLTVGRVGAPESQELGALTSGKAWSTIKVAIMARALGDVGGIGGLPAAEQELVRRAITVSDNAAAAQMFEALKTRYGGLSKAADAVTAVLREAGDERTVVSTRGVGGFSPYGQTDWSLADQHRFMALLARGDRILDPATSTDLLRLMGEVVPDQRWGLGAAGVPARFKGGWGPDPDGRHLVRQMGVLDLAGGNRPVVVTLAALPADGRFSTGTSMLTAMAKWIVANVDR